MSISLASLYIAACLHFASHFSFINQHSLRSSVSYATAARAFQLPKAERFFWNSRRIFAVPFWTSSIICRLSTFSTSTSWTIRLHSWTHSSSKLPLSVTLSWRMVSIHNLWRSKEPDLTDPPRIRSRMAHDLCWLGWKPGIRSSIGLYSRWTYSCRPEQVCLHGKYLFQLIL